MDLRTFRKPTVREALREAREALGADAVVVSTEMVPVPGLRGLIGRREVQITVALEPKVSAGRPSSSARRPSLIDAESEALVARLVASGLDRPMAEGIVRAIPYAHRRGASASRLFKAVADSVAPMTAVDREFAAAEVFVGPPGVGKTTTIAKIAARERARYGRALPMIAADGFRAGAVHQLKTYADIIGSAFRVAHTPDELEHALLRARRTVLVDTAGRSPKDGAVREQLEVLARQQNVRTHLVMAADTSVATARRLFDAYAEAKPDRVVITKLDEAGSLAPLATFLHERGIPVSYITTGQRVPDDIERATPEMLAGAILGELPEASEGAL
jgi:flagellar biosynthesis protein FlhF